MKTRLDDKIIETSSLEEMQDKYLFERVIRGWNEDFIDEDSGEVVSIQRNEIIFDKGTLLDKHTISELNFYFTSGDIKSVKVSEIQRAGTFVNSYTSVYLVSVWNFKKKLNYYLYANSVPNAIEIATDYLEQKLIGSFSFKAVKELNYSTLIPFNENLDNNEDDFYLSDEMDFYLICVQIIQEDYLNEQMFILRSRNAETAKKIIEKHLVFNLPEDRKDLPIELILLSAKVISCEDIIDYNFSKKYFEEEKE